ncbi:F0F1 ATP synthase subunit A [Longibacter salinarum]|uniref:ATP synthase subunit a n=1 Tax=Longibacter salinarum TaxID=1850348 RepID=A0A2A8D2J0_9BACT|nr:F0F1 ATP synthase subunit A [Longibacter salinarum]PEN14868.1 F0F1 ATP synthase subunit A [Longibacter salinarum]
MEFSPDQIVYWEWRFVTINATLVYSWIVVFLLGAGAWLITRNLTMGSEIPRWQNGMEVLVGQILAQIETTGLRHPKRYLPFIGTLFIFIVTCNILGVVPGFVAPTASVTTPIALAMCVFVAVPVYGIINLGLKAYLKRYIRPTPLMLPFTIIGEISRTVALGIRLFGNMMSGNLIVAILLSLAPLLFPVAMQAFGLLIGVIQAYVFAVLALVYIASGARAHQDTVESATEDAEPTSTV